MNFHKFLLISLLAVGGFVFFHHVQAATNVGDTMSSDQHWTLSGSPYLVQERNPVNGILFPVGTTLTIDPGVVVKFQRNAQMLIGGTLIANGTSDQPIIFTSIFDDAADGQDTDELGPTQGQVGDWYRISGGDPVIEFDHVQMKYSAFGLWLSFMTQPVSIRHSEFTHNSTAVYLGFENSVVSIEDSLFHDNGRAFTFVAFTNSSNFIKNNNISDNQVFGAENISFDLPIDMRGNWWGHASGPFHPTLNPTGQGNAVSDGIIFEPWLGSEVVIEPEVIDPVIIIPGILGSSKTGSGEFVIDPIFHVYDNLIETLEANGYEKGTNLFTFPYNWRDSNRFNALLLRDKINSVQEICQCEKVDLVGHSMGGLVAREYIQSESYENDVDQTIFLGTPHLGSLESYLSWEAGEFAPSITSGLKKFIFSREAKKAGFRSLYEYIRNRPISSVQELLPIYDYLREKSSGDLRVYPDNYPQNSFLENLDIDISQLYDSGIDILNIVGDTGETTINTIRVVESNTLPLWEHGFPDGFYEEGSDRGLEIGPGDGTVPEISSTAIVSEMKKVETDHVELVTQTEGIIYKELTGLDPAILINKPLRIPNVLLVIYMLSPADFQVIAPDGKRVGKNFDTGEEINEIDGAFYSGFLTDDEFITIPNPLDGEYQIITQGIDNGGEYTVSTGYISDDVLVETDFTAQTQLDLIAELELTVDNANPENLVVAPEDITPPEIQIISPESRDYLRSGMLSINVNIADADTGVFSTELRLDGMIVNDGDVIDLFFENLGNHSFTAEASDFVGNTASSDVQFRIIATIDSTISDVERAFALSWITSVDVKNSLIAKLLVAKKKGSVDKTTAKSLFSLMDAQRNKSINEQAYQLLKEDVNWLMNN